MRPSAFGNWEQFGSISAKCGTKTDFWGEILATKKRTDVLAFRWRKQLEQLQGKQK
jgi:hypothetical protein